MRDDRRKDRLILLGLLGVLVGLPLVVWTYDQHYWQSRYPEGAKVITLTGHAEKGWLVGEVRGYDVAALWARRGPMAKPVITVNKGDLVVLKLKSSDVVHGFSLKDFGVFVTDGIQPGRVKTVAFKADKAGRFQFSCNNICGDKHKNMTGFLVVRA